MRPGGERAFNSISLPVDKSASATPFKPLPLVSIFSECPSRRSPPFTLFLDLDRARLRTLSESENPKSMVTIVRASLSLSRSNDERGGELFVKSVVDRVRVYVPGTSTPFLLLPTESRLSGDVNEAGAGLPPATPEADRVGVPTAATAAIFAFKPSFFVLADGETML